MKRQQQTGRLNLYICYSPNFFDTTCYDSTADVIGELTEKEVSNLRTMISRYVERCHKRHGKLLLEAAITRGQCS